MKRDIKNRGRSVREKLLNLMRASGRPYMYLLARYFNERLLYRVSVSRYRENFLLKGGSLIYAMEGLDACPTVDIAFPEVMAVISAELKGILDEYWESRHG